LKAKDDSKPNQTKTNTENITDLFPHGTRVTTETWKYDVSMRFGGGSSYEGGGSSQRFSSVVRRFSSVVRDSPLS